MLVNLWIAVASPASHVPTPLSIIFYLSVFFVFRALLTGCILLLILSISKKKIFFRNDLPTSDAEPHLRKEFVKSCRSTGLLDYCGSFFWEVTSQVGNWCVIYTVYNMPFVVESLGKKVDLVFIINSEQGGEAQSKMLTRNDQV